jgi:MraZ protein
VFSGEYEHTLDDKGRVFLAARHRDELGPVVRVGRGLDGQINVYPQALWEALVARVEQAPEDEDLGAIRQISRYLFSAEPCDVDRQGRIVIPAPLREDAELESTVVILGHRDRVEIWNKTRWRELCQATRKQNAARTDDLKQAARLRLNI